MAFHVRHMSSLDAREISTWSYPEPYSFYDMDGGSECIAELLDGSYYSVVDRQDSVIGYYCFGKSAQVPVGHQFGAYDSPDLVDIGLGLKPTLCGRGLGSSFLHSGLEFARNQLSATGFRLTVAAFNIRATKVYTKAGFKRQMSFTSSTKMGKTEWIVMVL